MDQMKTIDEFKADAARLYDTIRDEGRLLSELHLAEALVRAYRDGAKSIVDVQTAAMADAAARAKGIPGVH